MERPDYLTALRLLDDSWGWVDEEITSSHLPPRARRPLISGDDARALVARWLAVRDHLDRRVAITLTDRGKRVAGALAAREGDLTDAG